MLLRELEAFEACWLDLKDQYPTSREDNTLIAHSMGQIVDLVEKPDQVERSLPDHLKILFRRLAIAYFQGYIPHTAPGASRPPSPPKPRSTGQAATATAVQPPPVQAPPEQRQKQEIFDAVEHVRILANQAQTRIQRSQASRPGSSAQGCRIEDMETLIVDFPEHWHHEN